MGDQTVSRTMNGHVFICACCGKYYVEYGNFTAAFTYCGMAEFYSALQGVDEEHYAQINKKSSFRRKVYVPIGNEGYSAVFFPYEIRELRSLIGSALGEKQKIEVIDTQKFFQFSCN